MKKNCNDEFDPNAHSVEQALDKILKTINPISDPETVGLHHVLGRILYKDISSTINVPAFTNSAMDGYAIRFSDISSEKSKLEIAGVAYAGNPYTKKVQPGHCIRIMTGACIPEGTDTVVMQEHVIKKDNTISISAALKKGQNIRQLGEDLAIGEIALPKGRRVTAADVGLIASLGISAVSTVRKLNVAFFSTGDELSDVESELEAGQIYDSNRYALYAMLQNLPVNIIDLGILKDDPNIIKSTLSKLDPSIDFIITSGGVSVGDADYIKDILDELGNVNFWKISMKPGRPLAFGTLKKKPFFGLPGNPVSAAVTFTQFVRPAILQILGNTFDPVSLLKVKCVSALKKRPGRTDYQRGILFSDENGDKAVKSTGNQGSHVLSSMSQANCFIVLPLESGNVEAGDWVFVQPFSDIM